MDLDNILKAIQVKLGENASGVPVYREVYVPSNLANKRETGYLAWSFNMDYFQECSEHLTGTVGGDLDIICYARLRSVRDTLQTNVMDLWLPKVNGLRCCLGPGPLTNGVYLHEVVLEGLDELFPEKTGHQEAETPGMMITFRTKLST